MRFGKMGFAVLLWTVFMQPVLAALPSIDGDGRPVPSLAPLIKQVSPAVVNISTVGTQTVRNPLLNDPFFRHFFNVPPGAETQQRRTQSAGSGVIIERKDHYYVLTNWHVIRGAAPAAIKINLADGRCLHPTDVLKDAQTDVAVLPVSAPDLVAASVGDSDRMQIGDFVLAVGSPFGLSHSVTFGIISAKGRRDLRLGNSAVHFQDFLQTDAAINPGNSGGPLVNLHGEVIGINTAIASNSGGNEGIGFSIPINQARRVAES